VKEADHFGLVRGRDTDKFAATNSIPVRSELVDAPYVQERPLVLECKSLHVIDLGLHTQFVGQILDVKSDEDVLDAAGAPCQAVIDIWRSAEYFDCTAMGATV
jgi:flavin reductase (DIM6/NTAB) family NADH-FMN oxidoreductase RutF